MPAKKKVDTVGKPDRKGYHKYRAGPKLVGERKPPKTDPISPEVAKKLKKLEADQKKAKDKAA